MINYKKKEILENESEKRSMMSKMNLPEFDPDEKVEIKEEELQKMND